MGPSGGRLLVLRMARALRAAWSRHGRPDWLFSQGKRPVQEDWAVWQLRFDGTVSGISGGVDIDVARIEVLREHAEIAEGEGAITHAAAEG